MREGEEKQTQLIGESERKLIMRRGPEVGWERTQGEHQTKVSWELGKLILVGHIYLMWLQPRISVRMKANNESKAKHTPHGEGGL